MSPRVSPQTLRVQSSDPETAKRPLGAKATHETVASCPLRLACNSPELSCHTFTIRSREPKIQLKLVTGVPRRVCFYSRLEFLLKNEERRKTFG
ncbi:hypothetical protein TNCT_540261 [Trichonephila clavata]|uniref:Uncharacterized protein n=1 Tax=Trichonephila clavata TaxID=2740835 RepID=A0A8X6FCC6_TRICU|nr:hypothetical protein TNCT_540261 [Trichonephila clavata]